MPREARFKLLIVGITLLLCAAVFGARGLLQEWKARHAPPPPPEPPRTEPAQIKSAVLDEAAVRELLPHLANATWVRYDPVTVVSVVPDKTMALDWPEHPGGRMTLRTNNMGFREDAPTQPQKHEPRVLVLGDSHTFGLVENSETFANLLEPGLGCEVINAGVSGTGPYETRALLGRLLPELHPDVAVFVLYTGNDFINAQAFADFEARRPRNPMPRDAQQRFAAAREVERERMAQNTSQVHSFKYRVGDADDALAATVQCLLEMAQYCDESGARFLVALLPTKEDIDLSDLGHMRATRDALGLCDEDFAIGRQLAARCEQALEERGVHVVDLRPALSGRREPMFWKRDHHLDVAGHKVVAGALLVPLRQLLAGR